MEQRKFNFIVDALGFIGFIFLTTTGIIVRYVLPPGSGHHTILWGLDRHEWGTVHFWIAIGFLCALILHLFLHWRWVVCIIRGQPSEGSGARFALGMIGLLGVIAIAVSPFWGTVEKTGGSIGTPSPQSDYTSSSDHSNENIRGRMTLIEIERDTGIPASYFIKYLGLPSEVSTDIGIAKLGRQYGFDIDDVRKAAANYKPQ